MDQLIFTSLSHTHYWYEVGMLKVPAPVDSQQNRAPTTGNSDGNRGEDGDRNEKKDGNGHDDRNRGENGSGNGDENGEEGGGEEESGNLRSKL